jgi:hypothetical protein
MSIERPQYYGFWITPEGMNSIFFMELSSLSVDGKMNGTIEDRLGRATFVGEKTNDKISFKKRYVGDLHPLTSKSLLYYEGNKIKDSENTFYEGTYTCKNEEGENLTGTFILQKFPSSKTLKSLLSEFHKNVLKI